MGKINYYYKFFKNLPNKRIGKEIGAFNPNAPPPKKPDITFDEIAQMVEEWRNKRYSGEYVLGQMHFEKVYNDIIKYLDIKGTSAEKIKLIKIYDKIKEVNVYLENESGLILDRLRGIVNIEFSYLLGR